jgi:hypothetical protein
MVGLLTEVFLAEGVSKKTKKLCPERPAPPWSESDESENQASTPVRTIALDPSPFSIILHASDGSSESAEALP